MKSSRIMRHCVVLAASLLGISSIAGAAAIEERAPTPWSNYNNNGVYFPPQNFTRERTLYGRSLQLADNSLLMTFESYDTSVPIPYWPIFKSTDGGATFTEISRVQDQINGWGNRYQPFLYTLPYRVGAFPAGTILIAGGSIPNDFSKVYIDLYASTDKGYSWKFVSHISYGSGPVDTANGAKVIWEPFLRVYNNELICYFSDQTDPAHGQKLVHVTSKDLKTWSDKVEDHSDPVYTARPGMTTVAQSPVSNRYVMTFEYCGHPTYGGCPVFFKTANSPLKFREAQAYPLVPFDIASISAGSPYVTWAKTGSNNGVFIASTGGNGDLWVNTDTVDPAGWKKISLPSNYGAYTRSVRVINTPANSVAAGAQKLFMITAGYIGCTGGCYNYVADHLIDIPMY